MLLRVIPDVECVVHGEIDYFVLLGNLSDGVSTWLTIFITGLVYCFLDQIWNGQMLGGDEGERLILCLVGVLIVPSLVYDVV
jgi:hypothetical protein